MSSEHRFVYFSCGTPVIGVVHAAEAPKELGVVIVVGGPQYRVGSHRLFVQLARSLAKSGFDTLRFDFAGMGDSHGDGKPFDEVDGELASALDELQRRRPNVRRIALVGLCDGATAAGLYAATDSRVSRIVLLNPWVKSSAGAAKVMISSYYFGRLMSRNFWRKLFLGRVRFGASIEELALAGKTALSACPSPKFVSRFERGIREYRGLTLIVLSGKDYTADEFRLWCRGTSGREAFFASSSVALYEQALANHTFSGRSEKGIVIDRIVKFFDGKLGSAQDNAVGKT